ncbi:MAG: hypothetical protein PHE17_18110 [Thiothrix sp.]|uniref:LamG-like jellyroll fold domain-containing protein n=1 Tax=Thiothrix sp. TaxID=1032 RepID=UPI00261CDED0|nr:LamG-like jellyroll fold domain-containing protein [Thiothrix sp.]MDD5394936.1 hypothetical protein [Thiothrix sp.]
MTAPVAWLKAENNVLDSMGNNIVGGWGNYTGSTTGEYVAGVVGNAFHFPYNGSNPYTAKIIRFSNIDPLKFISTNKFSIRFWLRPHLWTDYAFILADYSYPNASWIIGLQNGIIYVNYYLGNFNTGSIASLALDTWADWLITYNNGAWEFFINGISVYSTTGKVIGTPQTYYVIGGQDGGFDPRNYFAGDMDELKFYDEVITPSNNDLAGSSQLNGQITVLGVVKGLIQAVTQSGGNFDKRIFIGDQTTNGSWKIAVYGTALVFCRLESSLWVEKYRITA